MIAHTVLNPYLATMKEHNLQALASPSPTTTSQEALIEYAARTCYESTESMYKAAGFIKGLMRRRHFDVIEHVVATFIVDTQAAMSSLAMHNRFLRWCDMGGDKDTTASRFMVTANARVWFDLFNQNLLPRDTIANLRGIVPTVLGAIPSPPHPIVGFTEHEYKPITTEDDVTVTLLSHNRGLGGYVMPRRCTHLSFAIDGISVAAAVHLVRHRAGSYSQRSMRYVDALGVFDTVEPKVWRDKLISAEIRRLTGGDVMGRYGEMRRLGVPKQDARYILPVSTRTRIIASMHREDWDHFLDLRLAKDAQWEIRHIAEAIEKMIARYDENELTR